MKIRIIPLGVNRIPTKYKFLILQQRAGTWFFLYLEKRKLKYFISVIVV